MVRSSIYLRPSVIIDDLNVVGVAILPTKDHSPLIVDPNGVEPFPCTLQCFQSIPRRFTKIAKLRSIVQIEQLPTGHSYHIRWKSKNGLRQPIIEEVFCKTIGEGFNHEAMLSNLDNRLQGETDKLFSVLTVKEAVVQIAFREGHLVIRLTRRSF